MGFLRNMMLKKMANSIRDMPEARMVIDPIEGPGSYDGSATSKAKAEKYYNIIKNNIGDSNPNTRVLYEEVLQNSDLPIPLVACYAFAVGQFIEDSNYEPYGLNSEAAAKNLNSTSAFFPYYAKFVESRHSNTEAATIIIISGNIMEYFISLPPDMQDSYYQYKRGY